MIHTWTSFQLEARLDSGDGGDDGSVRHDGPVHIHLLGGGNRGADWQSVVGAARLFCFHILQLEEAAERKKILKKTQQQMEFSFSRYLS